MEWLKKEKAEQKKQDTLRRHINSVLKGEMMPEEQFIIEKLRRRYGRVFREVM